MKVGGQSAWWTLKTVMVQHVREAFQEPSRVEAQWRELDFSSRPDFEAAIREYEDFLGQLKGEDVEVVFQDHDPDCTLDALYAHDASLVTDGGIVLASMGKALRRPEVDAMAVTCERLGFPVLGRIEPPGLLEAGDVAWLGPRSVAVGQGYRTNPEGLRQLRELLGDRVDEVIPVPLPHWRGREEVLHLLSIISVVPSMLRCYTSC